MEDASDSEDERLLAEYGAMRGVAVGVRAAQERREVGDAVARVRDRSAAVGERRRGRTDAAAERRRVNEAALAQKRRERVAAAFGRHREAGGERRGEVEVCVGAGVGAGVVDGVRGVLGNAVVDGGVEVENMVAWRRGDGTGDDAGIVALCFDAELFLQHLAYQTLDGCARHIVEKRKGCQIMFLLQGVEEECRKAARRAVRLGATDVIISERAVQDCCTYLYMEYGILSRNLKKEEDVAEYLCQLTDGIAVAPYRKDSQFLDATMAFRDSKSKAEFTSVVEVERPCSRTGQAPDDPDDDPDDATSNAVVMRPENRRDLGYMYLAMLCLIPGVSINRARAIREAYPTLFTLLTAYSECASDAERDSMLSELTVGENSRRIGGNLSAKVAKVFTSLDPDVKIQW